MFVHQVPDLERKIDQMEEELNDLSAKCDKDDDDEEEEEEEEEWEDDIYIMMSVCVSVCHEKSSLRPGGLL